MPASRIADTAARSQCTHEKECRVDEASSAMELALYQEGVGARQGFGGLVALIRQAQLQLAREPRDFGARGGGSQKPVGTGGKRPVPSISHVKMQNGIFGLCGNRNARILLCARHEIGSGC